MGKSLRRMAVVAAMTTLSLATYSATAYASTDASLIEQSRTDLSGRLFFGANLADDTDVVTFAFIDSSNGWIHRGNDRIGFTYSMNDDGYQELVVDEIAAKARYDPDESTFTIYYDENTVITYSILECDSITIDDYNELNGTPEQIMDYLVNGTALPDNDDGTYSIPDEDAPETINDESDGSTNDVYLISDEDAPPTIHENDITVYTGSAAAVYVITGDELSTAYEKTGENTILYAKFNDISNYELTFDILLNNNLTKTYTATSSNIKNYESYIPIQDILDKLNITPNDISKITISGKDMIHVKSFDFERNFSPGKSDGKDDNPATGVAISLTPAAIAAAVAAIFKKKMTDI